MRLCIYINPTTLIFHDTEEGSSKFVKIVAHLDISQYARRLFIEKYMESVPNNRVILNYWGFGLYSSSGF
jgi:hypothetical protein